MNSQKGQGVGKGGGGASGNSRGKNLGRLQEFHNM